MNHYIQNEESISSGDRFKNDRYTVISLLDCGGQAQVFLVNDKEQNNKKAMKMVDRYKLETLREIELLKRIRGQCSYVIEYFDDFSFHAVKQCIVTEYLERRDLEKLIEKYKNSNRTLLPEKINYWAVQILEGIKFLHSNDIIHRDIKPKNVFLTEDSDVKLGDLGYSKSAKSMSETMSKIVGTTNYMSPEIVRENQNYTNKIDIWSFGCLFYELITLNKLFNGSNEYEIKTNILNTSPNECIPQTSDKFRQVLINSLKIDPVDRFTADDLLNILKNTNSSQLIPEELSITKTIVQTIVTPVENNTNVQNPSPLANVESNSEPVVNTSISTSTNTSINNLIENQLEMIMEPLQDHPDVVNVKNAISETKNYLNKFWK